MGIFDKKKELLEYWCNRCVSPHQHTYLDVDSDIIDGSVFPVMQAMDDYSNHINRHLIKLLKIHGYTDDFLNKNFDEQIN